MGGEKRRVRGLYDIAYSGNGVNEP